MSVAAQPIARLQPAKGNCANFVLRWFVDARHTIEALRALHTSDNFEYRPSAPFGTAGGQRPREACDLPDRKHSIGAFGRDRKVGLCVPVCRRNFQGDCLEKDVTAERDRAMGEV